MASTVRKIDYFTMNVPNRRGEAARILDSLREQGVNLLAFTGFPDKRGAQIDFIPENTAAFKAAARRAKLMLRAKKSGFLVQGDDRPGALSRVLDKLAEARINVTAVDAVCAGKNRFGALLWVKQKDVAKAKRALGAR
jgi:hypothetical protein